MTAHTAAQLRADFDRGFAEATQAAAASQQDFLAIKVDEHEHAVRLSEVAQLLPMAALAPLPGPLPSLLGIIGLRGAVVPVYDLRMLLGGAATQAPHWLVVAAVEPQIALAFDNFEGHLRLSSDLHVREADGEANRRHVRELLHCGESVRPVVSLASLHESIKTRVQHQGMPSGRTA